MEQGQDQHGLVGSQAFQRRSSIRRAGHAVLLVFSIGVGSVGALATYGWLEARQSRALRMEITRTHGTALADQPHGYVDQRAIALLGELPPLSDLHGNGLRFVAMPSFNERDYALALSLSPGARQAQGLMIVFSRSSPAEPPDYYHFAMPAEAYANLVKQLDQLTHGWRGYSHMTLDGVPAAFERIVGTYIASGAGNDSHYEKIGLLIYDSIKAYLPAELFPERGGWH